MNQIDRIPGLREILDECQARAQQLTGLNVAIHFSLQFKNYLSTEKLVQIVTEVCDVPWRNIASEERKAHFVLARHLYIYFALTVQKKSLREVGKTIGRLEHTTIVHARDKVKTMIEVQDELYYPYFLEIEKRINEALQ